jgi:cytochrome c556
MKATTIALAAAAGLASAAVPALAQDFDAVLKARQGEMRIMAINLGILGGMARGNLEYNAEMAQAAADTLVAVSQINQRPLWREGSDNMSIDGTKALPMIWDDMAGFRADWVAFGEAAAAAAATVANGQEALGPALRGIGGTCQACHEAFREADS